MVVGESTSSPEVVTEAIVVIDLVDATRTTNLFGWYAVGRGLLRDLRNLITQVGRTRGLRCMKSTGDGYLVTFYDSQSAEMAAINAVESIFELLQIAAMRNREVSEERALNVRGAIHLGR
jgi:class 3 adenylate cyclase